MPCADKEEHGRSRHNKSRTEIKRVLTSLAFASKKATLDLVFHTAQFVDK